MARGILRPTSDIYEPCRDKRGQLFRGRVEDTGQRGEAHLSAEERAGTRRREGNVWRKMKTTAETRAVNQHVPRHNVSINSPLAKENRDTMGTTGIEPRKQRGIDVTRPSRRSPKKLIRQS